MQATEYQCTHRHAADQPQNAHILGIVVSLAGDAWMTRVSGSSTTTRSVGPPPTSRLLPGSLNCKEPMLRDIDQAPGTGLEIGCRGPSRISIFLRASPQCGLLTLYLHSLHVDGPFRFTDSNRFSGMLPSFLASLTKLHTMSVNVTPTAIEWCDSRLSIEFFDRDASSGVRHHDCTEVLDDRPGAIPRV